MKIEAARLPLQLLLLLAAFANPAVRAASLRANHSTATAVTTAMSVWPKEQTAGLTTSAAPVTTVTGGGQAQGATTTAGGPSCGTEWKVRDPIQRKDPGCCSSWMNAFVCSCNPMLITVTNSLDDVTNFAAGKKKKDGSSYCLAWAQVRKPPNAVTTAPATPGKAKGPVVTTTAMGFLPPLNPPMNPPPPSNATGIVAMPCPPSAPAPASAMPGFNGTEVDKMKNDANLGASAAQAALEGLAKFRGRRGDRSASDDADKAFAIATAAAATWESTVRMAKETADEVPATKRQIRALKKAVRRGAQTYAAELTRVRVSPPEFPPLNLVQRRSFRAPIELSTH